MSLPKKKRLLSSIFLLLFSLSAQAASPLIVDSYRDPNCGCCKDWIKHLEKNGITVRDHVSPDMAAVKKKIGVPSHLRSCHTATINGKFIEGHVPADQVKSLVLRNDLTGIAVPGMPLGSPGMEVNGKRHAHDVIGVRKNGRELVVLKVSEKQ